MRDNDDDIIRELLYEKRASLKVHISQMKEQMSDAEKQYQAIDEAIQRFNSKVTAPVNEHKEKSADQPAPTIEPKDLEQAIKRIFIEQGKFLAHRQILDQINTNYPKIRMWYTELSRKISITLNKLKAKGTLVSIKTGDSNKDHYWGSGKWLDGSGKIRAGYEPDKEQFSEDNIDL